MNEPLNGGSWAILEKVQIPAAATTGWHFFRHRSRPDLLFATEITDSGVLKAGGSGGGDSVNGNTPEFYLELM